MEDEKKKKQDLKIFQKFVDSKVQLMATDFCISVRIIKPPFRSTDVI